MKSRTLLLTALLGSTCAALPAFFSREEIHLRVAQAFEAETGWSSASLLDRALAVAWNTAGINSAEILLFLLTFVPWLLLFILLALIASRLRLETASWIRSLGLLGAIVLGLHGLLETHHARRSDLRTPELIGPLALAGTASTGRVLLDHRVSAFARMFGLPAHSDPSALADTLQSPLAWRTEHRKTPFSAVVLTYPFTTSRPLIEMLQAAPGWTLSLLDNQGIVFLASPAVSVMPSVQQARDLFESPRDQALWLAQSSIVLDAVGQPSAATALLDEALALAPADDRVLTQAASLSAAHGKWQRAKSEARAAVDANPRSIPARYLLALTSMKTGALDSALEESEKLVRLAPHDASSHLLRARIADAAKDPATEAASLERLLTIAQSNNHPTEGIRILLGQAWARAGFPALALENHKAALNADLTPDQRKQIEESIEQIESRALSGR